MNNFQKILANSLLLVLVAAVVILPSVSSGIMRISKDDRVLSVMDERTQTLPVKSNKKPTTTPKKTIIIKEIQEQSPSVMHLPESTESTSSETRIDF